jgi:hypothetical protein
MLPKFSWSSEDNNTKRARKRPLTWHLFAGQMHLGTLYPSENGDRYKPHFYIPVAAIAWKTIDEAKVAAQRAAEVWFEACYAEAEG